MMVAYSNIPSPSNGIDWSAAFESGGASLVVRRLFPATTTQAPRNKVSNQECSKMAFHTPPRHRLRGAERAPLQARRQHLLPRGASLARR